MFCAVILHFLWFLYSFSLFLSFCRKCGPHLLSISKQCPQHGIHNYTIVTIFFSVCERCPNHQSNWAICNKGNEKYKFTRQTDQDNYCENEWILYSVEKWKLWRRLRPSWWWWWNCQKWCFSPALCILGTKTFGFQR